jgi:hypothetical protein
LHSFFSVGHLNNIQLISVNTWTLSSRSGTEKQPSRVL